MTDMSTINKKEISEVMIEAMNREELNTRAVAQHLNLNPCYISMAKNPNHWDTMGITAWRRLQDWLDTRGKISEFKIPEGEEIFVPKSYVPKAKKEGKIEAKPAAVDGNIKVNGSDLSSVLSAESDRKGAGADLQIKTEVSETQSAAADLKNGKKHIPRKIKVPLFNKEEIDALDKKFTPLFALMEKVVVTMEKQSGLLAGHQQSIQGLVDIYKSIKKESEVRPQLVIFQRNIYQK